MSWLMANEPGDVVGWVTRHPFLVILILLISAAIAFAPLLKAQENPEQRQPIEKVLLAGLLYTALLALVITGIVAWIAEKAR